MPTHQINFVRNEDGISTTIAMVTATTNKAMSNDELVNAIDRSVSNWMNETDIGVEAWADSCEDFNIGDLVDYSTDPSLTPYMQEQGIEGLTIITSDGDNCFDFDRILGGGPDQEAGKAHAVC